MTSTGKTVRPSLVMICLILSIFGCGAIQSGPQEQIGGGEARHTLSHPYSQTASLTPGIAVKYHRYRYRSVKRANQKTELRHISDMPGIETMEEKGYAGAPVPRLAHRAGLREEVFGSGANRLICAQFKGFIHFARPGRYRLKVESNDGFRLFIDGRMVLEDPEWHSDRTSPPAVLDVQQPGWYPLMVRYYQRKGSSALLLHWLKPDDTDYEIVPAEAYSHLATPS